MDNSTKVIEFLVSDEEHGIRADKAFVSHNQKLSRSYFKKLILNGNLYRNIEWPVVGMLAAMIPVGQALETSGISLNIANFISASTEGMTLPWLILMILVITMFVLIMFFKSANLTFIF